MFIKGGEDPWFKHTYLPADSESHFFLKLNAQ